MPKQPQPSVASTIPENLKRYGFLPPRIDVYIITSHDHVLVVGGEDCDYEYFWKKTTSVESPLTTRLAVFHKLEAIDAALKHPEVRELPPRRKGPHHYVVLKLSAQFSASETDLVKTLARATALAKLTQEERDLLGL